MYKNFFKLSEMPFSIVPSSRYIFLSARHREAMHYLQSGLGNGGGFGLMTGEVGTGKTTLSKVLLAQLDDNVRAGLLLNPTYSPTDLLEAICDEFSIIYPSQATMKQLTQLIYQYLLNNHANGLFTLLVIDEAQLLSAEVLEQLRLLTNLETDTQKLLKVLLIGQPELQHKLQQPNLRQLAQRITARYHLLPLTEDEVKAYIAFRLDMAGNENNVFSVKAMDIIAVRTEGIPRLVNLVCDKALFYAYQASEEQISPAIAEKACDEALYFISPPNNVSTRNDPIPSLTGGSNQSQVTDVTQAHNTTQVHNTAQDQNNTSAPYSDVNSTSNQNAAPVVNSALNQYSNVSQQNVNTNANANTALTSNSNEAETQPQNSANSAKLKLPWKAPSYESLTYGASLFAGLLMAFIFWFMSPSQAINEPVAAQNVTTVDNTQDLINPLIKKSHNMIKSMNDLISIWGYKAKPNEGDCRHLSQVGLNCYQARGSINDLVALNRPAVLTMREKYRTYFFVLYKLSDKYAHLLLAGEHIRVPRTWLEANWGGEYKLLWHSSITNMSLKLHDKDVEVQQLARALSQALGDKSVMPYTHGEAVEFDATIKRKIEAFQTWQGLDVTGELDEVTLMRLDSISNLDAPMLNYEDSSSSNEVGA